MTSAQSQAKLSPSVAEAGDSLSSLPLFKPSLVIFDKDGTLVCFHTMWNSWCEQLASRCALRKLMIKILRFLTIKLQNERGDNKGGEHGALLDAGL